MHFARKNNWDFFEILYEGQGRIYFVEKILKEKNIEIPVKKDDT